MGGSLLFTLPSSLSPPSSSSSLLQPSPLLHYQLWWPWGEEWGMQQPLSQSFRQLFSLELTTILYQSRDFFLCYISSVRRNLTGKSVGFFVCLFLFFFLFEGTHLKRRLLFFKLCSYDSVLPLWYSDPVIIPLWLLLCVSTGVVKIGLLLCPCCQTFGEGCSEWSLTLEELKRGRNPQKMVWLGGEDDLSWSLRSLAFREQRESDVEQHLEVLDVNVFIFHSWTNQGEDFYFTKKKCFALGQTLFFTFTTWLGCMDASRAGSKLFIKLIWFG